MKKNKKIKWLTERKQNKEFGIRDEIDSPCINLSNLFIISL